MRLMFDSWRSRDEGFELGTSNTFALPAGRSQRSREVAAARLGGGWGGCPDGTECLEEKVPVRRGESKADSRSVVRCPTSTAAVGGA